MNSVGETHPLQGNRSWEFTKPYIGFSSALVIQDEHGTPSKKTISNGGSCREGVLTNIRSVLRGTSLVEKKKLGPQEWQVELVPSKHKELLEHPSCLSHGESKLIVSSVVAVDAAEFLAVANAIVGIPCLLLNPRRAPGDWWKTSLEEFKPGDVNSYHWYGTDNFFLRHPTLLAIVLGLYRQAWLLCKAGVGKEILKCVTTEEVEETLTAVNYQKAFELAEKLRPWISVPVATGGEIGNFPFPWYSRRAKQLSHWQRFIRLQRAARRHGYDAVFNQNFLESWNLLSKTVDLTGVFQFWGGSGDVKATAAHKRVMELGKPLSRKTDVSE